MSWNLKLNIHKDVMVCYNIEYCIKASFERS
jgi:hypothetical protein